MPERYEFDGPHQMEIKLTGERKLEKSGFKFPWGLLVIIAVGVMCFVVSGIEV